MIQVTANLFKFGSYPPIHVAVTTLLNLLLFHCASLMPPGCGVVASAMLFLVFNGVTIIIILYVLTGDIDCVQMSCLILKCDILRILQMFVVTQSHTHNKFSTYFNGD